MYILLLAPLLLFSYFLQALGLRGFSALASVVGALLYYLNFRKKIVRANLQLALGSELSFEEIENLMKRNYKNTAQVFLGIARNFSLSREKIKAEMKIGKEDKTALFKVLAQGKGAIIISAHIANWELFATGMAAHGFPVSVVVKKMNNPLAQKLIERQRIKTGMEVIYSGNTLVKMKETLRRGHVIGFMVDQNVTGKKGIRANFFGVPAASIRGLANLVKETGVHVVPVCAFRLPDGTHEVKALPPLEYLTAENPSLSEAEKILREEWLNTQQYQSSIETLIRLHPEQWLWIHRRWKTDRTPIDVAKAHLEKPL